MGLDLSSIEKALLAARVHRPYYAPAIAALRPREQAGLNTVGVTQDYLLLIDPVAWERWTDDERAAVICHEVEHVLRRHGNRRLERDPILWNIAGDAEINDDLDDLPLPDGGGVKPGKLQPPQPDHLLAETYYNEVEGQYSKTTLTVKGCGGVGHVSVVHKGELTEADRTAIEQGVAHAMQEHAKQAGKVPAGMKIWADAVLAPPKRDWRADLRVAVSKGMATTGKEDYTWSKISRRHRHGQPLRPGLYGHLPRVALVIDSSGSMGGEGSMVGRVAEEVIRSARGASVVAGDVGVSGKWKTVRTFKEVLKQVVGGGGTDLTDSIVEAGKAADVVVVVTDCEWAWPAAAPTPATVIVAAIGAAQAQVPEWARVVQVEA